ncbi:translation initiation factor IF-2-like [Panicum virgatum]|uniref:translation initiation factor IF-2-like n=1 Tax=Panicum virgatum TaxID=38727 RepID=UPI0019D52DEC|nr:translation initiation factor IF-2-like [Panicum virgatum]
MPKGYFAVYAGEESQRFVVPTGYLREPAFRDLMEHAAEFGFTQAGGACRAPRMTSRVDKATKIRCRAAAAPLPGGLGGRSAGRPAARDPCSLPTPTLTPPAPSPCTSVRPCPPLPCTAARAGCPAAARALAPPLLQHAPGHRRFAERRKPVGPSSPTPVATPPPLPRRRPHPRSSPHRRPRPRSSPQLRPRHHRSQARRGGESRGRGRGAADPDRAGVPLLLQVQLVRVVAGVPLLRRRYPVFSREWNTLHHLLPYAMDAESSYHGSIHVRRFVPRERVDREARIICQYFAANPIYTLKKFRERFRMKRHVFIRILNAVQSVDSYFQ